jgi:O-antigen/teichoic acid export membrane protein
MATAVSETTRRVLGRREDSLAVQSLILTAARAAGFIITFAIPLVLVRVFDQDGFGLYKQLFLIVGTAVPILNLGLYASIFYFVPRDGGDGQRYIVQALGLLTLTGALAAMLLIVNAGWLADTFGAPSLREYAPLLGLCVLLATPTEVFASAPVVDRRPVLAAWVMTASDVVRAILIIGAAVVVGTLTSVLWATIISASLRGVWLLWYLRVRAHGPTRPPSRVDLTAQLRYSLPFAGAVVFEIGLSRFHEYFVAANVSAAEFAVYAVGILQLPVLGMLVQSVVEVMLISSAAAYKGGDRASLQRVWHTALQRLAIALVPCWALAEVVAPEMISLLFGPEYAASIPVFRMFTFTVLLWMIVDHGILRATGDTPFLVAANATGFVASVAVVLALAPVSIPLAGIASYLVGMLVMRGLGVWRVSQRLGLGFRRSLPWGALAPIFAVSIASAMVAWGVRRALPESDLLLRIIIPSAAFALTYGFMAIRFGLVAREEIRALVRRFAPT